jgi:sn-glycerol 3-phosphate transport system permease protein
LAQSHQSPSEHIELSNDRQAVSKTTLMLRFWSLHRIRARLVPYLYLLPALALLLVFVYWPLLRTIELSFYDWNMISPVRDFVGWQHYQRAMAGADFRQAVFNTVWYISALLVIDVALVFGVALGLLAVPGKSRQLYRSLIFVPTLISMAVAAAIWLWMLHPLHGVFNRLLALVGVNGPSWLSDSTWALWAVAAVAAWKYFGYNLIVMVAGLTNVPREYLEAARIDGAGRWALFRHIIWPLVAPTALYLFVTTIVLAAQIVFTPIDVLTQGGPQGTSSNLMYLIFQYGFQFFNIGYASAVAVIVFVVFLAVTGLKVSVLERGIHYEA